MSHFRRDSNTGKLGDWLVQDDVTGVIHKASDIVIDWKGRAVHKNEVDYKHPQEYPIPVIRELPPPFVRPISPDVFLEQDDNPFQDEIDAFYAANVASTQSSGEI